MKFTNIEQIKQVIKDNPAKDMLSTARETSKKLTMYVTGEGLIDSLEKMPFFEQDGADKVKRKIAKSTRDLFERLLQPEHRVFTAKGGIRVYGMGQSQDAEFDKYLNSVRRGMSMKEWVQMVGRKAALLDPMSLTYTEVGKDGKGYPTYKSTGCIYDYLLTGRQPEYVIFELSVDDINLLVSNGIITKPEEGLKLLRVVDDAKEYILSRKGEEVTVLKEYPHPHGKVPGLISASKPVFNSPMYESDLMPVMELAAEFFSDDSSKMVFKKYQMYPREWSIELTCPRCDGEKVFGGEPCGTCDGTGIMAHIKPAQRISVAVNDEGKAMTPIPPGGFYTPPVESWDRMNTELDNLEIKMNDTYWGPGKVRRATGPTGQGQDGNLQTATGELIAERSKEPKLRDITKWAEGIDKNQTDNIKLVMFKSKAESTIKYGDRYMHGTVEELTEYYETIRRNGAPISMLDRALLDIYESNFDSNPAELRRQVILMRVEPFVHNSVNEVLGWNIDQQIKDEKAYFTQWLSTVTLLDVLRMQEKGCRDALTKYVKDNVVVPEPVDPKKVPA